MWAVGLTLLHRYIADYSVGGGVDPTTPVYYTAWAVGLTLLHRYIADYGVGGGVDPTAPVYRGLRRGRWG